MTTKKVASTKKKTKYDANSVVWSKGLDGPRRSPEMYLGSADGNAIAHGVRELVGNAIDEISSGHGTTVSVKIDANNVVTVSDDGRGVPVEPHPTDKSRSTLDIVFSELHAGGKGKEAGGAYETSIGTFGLGAAVTNACADLFEVTVKRGGRIHRMVWSKGKVKKPFKVIGKCPKAETGTTVVFQHDPTILSGKPNWKSLYSWVEQISYFTPGVVYKLDIAPLKIKTTIKRKHGLQDWLTDNSKGETENITKPIVVQTKSLDLALQWFGKADDGLRSYVSAVETTGGGTHHKAVEKAIVDVLGKFAGQRGAAKKAYKPEDLRAGIIGCVNVRLKAPKFSSQTKEKLVSPEGETIVYQEAVKELTAYFNKHKSTARAIIERANRLRAAHENFKMSAKAAAALKPKRGQSNLPAKLAVSDAKDRSKVTLYLVEGDSAAGSLIQARDATKDEVLALKGKPPNIMKGKQAAALENEEIINILRSIGYDPSNKDDHLAKMRVGKVGILSDSDDDGFHVTNLVIALLWTITPQLITEGKVFVVSDALFMAKSATKTVFASSVEEAYTKIGTKKATITRVKGWGEANPADLAIHVFDDATKQHINVTGEKANEIIKVMGEDISYRREILGV